MITTRKILAAIGHHHLSLYPGEGYWYFVYDNGSRYHDRSVMVFRLSHMTLDEWVTEGQNFIREVENRVFL